jgi:hypothetical protein
MGLTTLRVTYRVTETLFLKEILLAMLGMSTLNLEAVLKRHHFELCQVPRIMHVTVRVNKERMEAHVEPQTDRENNFQCRHVASGDYKS